MRQAGAGSQPSHRAVAAIGIALLLAPGCSRAPQSRGNEPILAEVNFQLANGDEHVALSVPQAYFAAPGLPPPDAAVVDAFTLVVDYPSGQPSASSPRERPDTISIFYKSYVEDLIADYLNPAKPNYYTMYKVPGQAFGLKKLDLEYNNYLGKDHQDRSFILVGADPVDGELSPNLMIECRNLGIEKPTSPCEMTYQFSNGIVAQVLFERAIIEKWADVLASVKRISAKIGIDGKTDR